MPDGTTRPDTRETRLVRHRTEHLHDDLIADALRLAHTDDAAFLAHVETLRAHPDETIAAAGEYIEAFANDPTLLWTIAFLLDHTGLESARPLLTKLVNVPVKHDERSCQSEGDLFELVAIQAAEALARQGAVDEITRIVSSHAQRAVRIAAARAAVAVDADLQRDLADALGADADLLRHELVAAGALTAEIESSPERAGVDAPRLGARGKEIAHLAAAAGKDRPALGRRPLGPHTKEH